MQQTKIEQIKKEIGHKIKLSRLSRTGLFNNDKFFGIEDKSVQADVCLHRTVLDRALLDYFHEDNLIRNDVEEWLDPENGEFIDACERARIEPILVYETFLLVEEMVRENNDDD